jgi:hypothetical protein
MSAYLFVFSFKWPFSVAGSRSDIIITSHQLNREKEKPGKKLPGPVQRRGGRLPHLFISVYMWVYTAASFGLLTAGLLPVQIPSHHDPVSFSPFTAWTAVSFSSFTAELLSAPIPLQ